ncbi:MAG: hypothetical protein VXW32_07640 [Myxococcota bacterium]|nr:hypothetical protein [Myxococcota bacterium]
MNPATAPLWDSTVDGSAQWAIDKAGFQLVETLPNGPCLLLRERVAVRPEALRAAWEIGKARGESCSFALDGRAGEFLKNLPGNEAGPVLAYSSGDPVPEHLGTWPQVLLPSEEKPFEMALHQSSAEIFLSDRLVVPLDHWVDLLWANLLGLGPRIWGRAVGRPALWAVFRLAWAACRAFSTRPEKLAARLTVSGEGTRIHPTAVVEACVLGRGVRVGAGAVLRGCVLGDDTRVEELAVCEGVVAGKGSLIQRQALLKFSVIGEEAAIGGATQLSVMGTQSSLKRGAYGMDQSFDGDVRYRSRGLLHKAPFGLLGICLGEDSKLGAGVSVAPGRSIAAGCRLIADAVVDPSTEEPGLYQIRNGGLERLK